MPLPLASTNRPVVTTRSPTSTSVGDDEVIINVVLDRSAGLFPPVPAVCVCSVFGEGPFVHPAMSTVTATITAVAPNIDIFPINVPLATAVSYTHLTLPPKR